MFWSLISETSKTHLQFFSVEVVIDAHKRRRAGNRVSRGLNLRIKQTHVQVFKDFRRKIMFS